MVHLCNEKLFHKPLTLLVKLLDFGSGLLLYLFILQVCSLVLATGVTEALTAAICFSHMFTVCRAVTLHEGKVREQMFSLLYFQMFNPLNITIVLSSLELWAEGDKISTAGDTDDLLQRFLQWKQLSLEPQVHNIASLLG